jgi:peptide-methionine (S)-S-oxide reductase
MKTLVSSLFLSLLLFSCNSSKAQSDTQENNENKTTLVVSNNEPEVDFSQDEEEDIDENKLVSAYFASGCFWCVEAIYEHTKGVKEVISGYAGGHTKNPTYGSSNTGKTGHAEAVEVIYDSSIISFKQLVDIYYGTQNIEQVNGQGNDRGSQYRSIIFYSDAIEYKIINNKISDLKSIGLKPAAEVKEHDRFWVAEDYHQDYERLHPNQSYIRAVSVPRLNKFKSDFPKLLK